MITHTPPVLKESFDLSAMDRFDASSGTLQISIGKQRITLTGQDTRLEGDAFALYAGRAGRNPFLLMAVKADPHGYTAVHPGGKSHAKRLSGTTKFINLLLDRGVEIPQVADLNWDEANQAFGAKLMLLPEAAEPAKKLKGETQA